MGQLTDDFKQNLLLLANTIVPVTRGCFYEVDGALEPRGHVVLGGDTRWIKPYDSYRVHDPFHPRHFQEQKSSIFTSRDRAVDVRLHTVYIEQFMRPIGVSHKVELFLRDRRQRIVAGLRLGRTSGLGEFDGQALERLELLRPVLERACMNSLAESGAQGFRLTPRETQVMECLAEGLPDKLVAQRLNLSLATAKLHAKTLYRKLGVHGRAEAVSLAYRSGLI